MDDYPSNVGEGPGDSVYRDSTITIRSGDCFDNHIDVQLGPYWILCIKIVDSTDGRVELTTKGTTTSRLLEFKLVTSHGHQLGIQEY